MSEDLYDALTKLLNLLYYRKVEDWNNQGIGGQGQV